MKNLLSDVLRSLRASPIFAVYVLVTLGVAAAIAGMTLVMTVQPGFLGMAHFSEPSHRIHDLTYGFIFTTAVIGILTQLRNPSRNIAGMLMALIPWIGLLLAALLSTSATVIASLERVSVAVLTVFVALLHPAGRNFFRSFSVARINWVMLALVAIAAVPLFVFASTNIRLQGIEPVTDPHTGMGHYGFMAAFSFTVIGVGLLASLRPEGWRPTAWVAGLLPALLGLASLVYQVSSSLRPLWAIAAIAWGVAFVAVSERTRGRGKPAEPLPHVEAAEASPGSATNDQRIDP